MKLFYRLTFTLCYTCGLAYGQSPINHQNIIDIGIMPQVFAPGIISTPYTEWATSFMPNGKTVYSSQGALYWTIIFSELQNNKWTKPQVANFSGRFRDTDPSITPDGKRIYFISSRPQENAPQDKAQKAVHIWVANYLGGNKWSKPIHLDSSINLDGVDNYAPSVSNSGTIYYCSRRNGLQGMQSFYATWLGDHFDKPKHLIIEGTTEIQDPFIAPDENYLIFLNGNDIYISFRNSKGWSSAEKLGAAVNNGDNNSSPYVSPDGKMLYYSSARISGFYKRDPKNHAVNYDELVNENSGLFNTQSNILMIPIHLPVTK